MTKAAQPIVYAFRAQDDGSVKVFAPTGETVAHCPNQQMGGILLGWMRLAGWAHAQLRDSPTKLNEVLGVADSPTSLASRLPIVGGVPRPAMVGAAEPLPSTVVGQAEAILSHAAQKGPSDDL